MDLDQKIIQAIKDSLPEVAANELKEFIATSQEEHEELISLREENKQYSEEIQRLRNVEREYELRIAVLNTRESDLNNRNKEITKKELEADRDKAVYEAEEAKKRTADIMHLVERVFGHPSVQISRSSSVPIVKDWMIQSAYGSDTETRTETKI